MFNNCIFNKESVMYNNLKYIASKCEASIQNLLKMPKPIILDILKFDNPDDWRVIFIKELFLVRENMYLTNLNEDEFLILLNDLCTR